MLAHARRPSAQPARGFWEEAASALHKPGARSIASFSLCTMACSHPAVTDFLALGLSPPPDGFEYAMLSVCGHFIPTRHSSYHCVITPQRSWLHFKKLLRVMPLAVWMKYHVTHGNLFLKPLDSRFQAMAWSFTQQEPPEDPLSLLPCLLEALLCCFNNLDHRMNPGNPQLSSSVFTPTLRYRNAADCLFGQWIQEVVQAFFEECHALFYSELEDAAKHPSPAFLVALVPKLRTLVRSRRDPRATLLECLLHTAYWTYPNLEKDNFMEQHSLFRETCFVVLPLLQETLEPLLQTYTFQRVSRVVMCHQKCLVVDAASAVTWNSLNPRWHRILNTPGHGVPQVLNCLESDQENPRR